MPGPYREVKKVGCQVGARCGGGVKTPPYEWKIQWQQTQSVRAPPPFDKGGRVLFIANLSKTVALALA